MCNLTNTHTHTHTHTPREDQCEWHRMTRMTGPDCVVMCNLINTHTHTHTHTIFAINFCRIYLVQEEITLYKVVKHPF